MEDAIHGELKALGIEALYEPFKIEYTKPAKPSKYTPDFVLPSGVIIETKGRFVTADRQKHLLIQAQRPDLEVRFIFSNANARISKQSQTTYAMWCDRNGFKYAHRHFPKEWL